MDTATQWRRAPKVLKQWWRRWESKTWDFVPTQATTGNNRKPDPELPESKHEEKHFRENALPTGKIEPEVTQGRADVGDVPTAETLGALARKVLSSPRHAESLELARAVLQLLARGSDTK
ncbi:MAG: hypothetical protein WBN01_13620 [Polyangiales bacterium]